MLANYINVDAKARLSLINGPLVLYDEAAGLKSVTIIKGLIKKRALFSSTIVANSEPKGSMLEGIVYRVKKDGKPPSKVGNERHELTSLA